MDLVSPIREYIEARYSPEEAKEAEEDLETLALLRSEVVANTQTNEQRRETLLAYYRALSVVEGRFPVSKQGGHVNLPFTWTDAFNTRKSTTLASVRFEKAATLFNLGCTWSQRGCGADREDVEGIKTAAHAFQHAAGAFACGGDSDSSADPLGSTRVRGSFQLLRARDAETGGRVAESLTLLRPGDEASEIYVTGTLINANDDDD